ncbi:hypothetical protein YC2023_051559 [Brassica napus]
MCSGSFPNFTDTLAFLVLPCYYFSWDRDEKIAILGKMCLFECVWCGRGTKLKVCTKLVKHINGRWVHAHGRIFDSSFNTKPNKSNKTSINQRRI